MHTRCATRVTTLASFTLLCLPPHCYVTRGLSRVRGEHKRGAVARSSVKIPRARHELAEQRRAVDEPVGDEMRDARLLLQLAVHLEQP
jgi:hypothetical protein